MQVVTRSLEAQPRRSQRILKPSTLPSTHFRLKCFKGGRVVFGSPATQMPVNPKARHPTPVIILSQMIEPLFDAVLTHLIFEKPARRRLPPGLHYQLNTIGKSRQEKLKPDGPSNLPCRRRPL